MTDLRQAAQQALEALELHGKQYPHMVKGYCLDAITALRTALLGQQQAEPPQEPKYMVQSNGRHSPLLTHMMNKRTTPPQQQAEPVGWKPIETAPKDEIVLLFLPLIGNIREGDRRVYEGRWHEARATWTSINGFLLLGAATYWMPLPQPPITAHGIKENT